MTTIFDPLSIFISSNHRNMALRISLFLLASTFIPTILASRSAGCGKNLPAAQSPPGGPSHQTDFTQSDGTPRTYLIHIPSNYDRNTPVPLIFSFHGRGKNSAEQEELSQFSNEEFNKNGIAVYPQGLDVSYLSYLQSKLSIEESQVTRPLKRGQRATSDINNQ